MEQTAAKQVHVDIFPTQDQITAWNSLSRDEQVEQKKQRIDEAYNSGVDTRTREEVRELAEKKIVELKAKNSA